MIKTVIRIENDEGYGIHHGNGVRYLPHEIRYKADRLWNKFPTPMEEFKRYISCNERCAFTSIDQFRNTIPDDILKYHIEQGFKVFILKLKKNDVKISKHQTLFDPDEHVLERKDITQFLFLDWEIKNNTFIVKI